MVDCQELCYGLLPNDIWKIIFSYLHKSSCIDILCLSKNFYKFASKTFLEIVTDHIIDLDGKYTRHYEYLIQGIFPLFQTDNTAVPEQAVVCNGTFSSAPILKAKDTIVTLPITEPLCKDLISKSEYTPFGRGMETVVDPSKQK